MTADEAARADTTTLLFALIQDEFAVMQAFSNGHPDGTAENCAAMQRLSPACIELNKRIPPSK